MPFFNTSRTRHHRAFYRRDPARHRRDPDRVAGGYKAALSNPKTSHEGRRRAKAELHAMGRSSHVPFMTKVRRALGIRKTPRRERKAESRREREYEYGTTGRSRRGRREREYY